MLDSSPIFTQSLIEKPLITALALAFTAYSARNRDRQQ